MIADGVNERELGLRERKRRATRRNIQLAVLRLTAEHGLDQVTIDDISRDAGISPRTFFNYFAGKEDSLTGDAPFALSAEVARVFEDGGPDGDPLGELVTIMAAEAAEAVEIGGADRELHELRRAVMNDYPQIFALKIGRMREFEAELAAIVRRRLDQDAAKRGEVADVTETAEKSRLIALTTLTLARGAWVAWAEHPDSTSLPEQLMRSYGQLRDIVGARERV